MKHALSLLAALFTLAALAAPPARAADDSPAADQSNRKVLVFSMTKGFHHQSIPLGLKVMTEIGQRTKAFTAVCSDDLANFDPDKIQQFAAIVFLNTTGEIPFSDEQKKALLDFVSNGKGFVGIHSATDTLYKWDGYGDLIGGHFDGHPWTAGTTVTIRTEKRNALTDPFPPTFQLTEEIYQMKAPYDRSKCDVCMSLDTAKTDMTRKGIKRTDGDFPICWIKPFGKGRVFYTSLGHNEAVWQRKDYQDHLLAGVRYALGDLAIDFAPHALPATQPAAAAE